MQKRRLSSLIVTKPKFMCLTHSEAKQTETSGFGAEKGLLQGQARRMGGSCSKNPELPDGFWGEVFNRQNLGGGLQGV